MHPNAALITRFYTAFSTRDAATMGACYAEDATFSDPVFDLRGPRIGGMWRMLCERGTDLQIVHSGVEADDATGRAHWDAAYTFSATGRKVLNRIDASFTFVDGRIQSHTDTFDFWAWTRMALGPTGMLLGWTPLLRNKVRGQAAKGLEQYLAKAEAARV